MKKKLVSIYLGILLIIPIFSMSVIANQPPSTPTIDGPTNGTPGTSYDYTFMSIDPDGDNVYYMVSWGCCGPGQDFHSYGPYESGVETTISKTYNEQGTYTLSAYAKDINNAESDITTLEVTMPMNTPIITPFLHRWLEQFPNAFPILRSIFGI
jgi:hypothetical protein